MLRPLSLLAIAADLHPCRPIRGEEREVASHVRLGSYRIDPQDGVNAENCWEQFLPAIAAYLHPCKQSLSLLSGTDMQCEATAQTIVCKGRFICAANMKTCQTMNQNEASRTFLLFIDSSVPYD